MNPVELLVRSFGISEHKAQAVVDSGFIVETTMTRDSGTQCHGSKIAITRAPVAILYRHNTSYLTGTSHPQDIDVTMPLLDLLERI